MNKIKSSQSKIISNKRA